MYKLIICYALKQLMFVQINIWTFLRGFWVVLESRWWSITLYWLKTPFLKDIQNNYCSLPAKNPTVDKSSRASEGSALICKPLFSIKPVYETHRAFWRIARIKTCCMINQCMTFIHKKHKQDEIMKRVMLITKRAELASMSWLIEVTMFLKTLYPSRKNICKLHNISDNLQIYLL